jgi:hypothetical protein
MGVEVVPVHGVVTGKTMTVRSPALGDHTFIDHLSNARTGGTADYGLSPLVNVDVLNAN